MLRRIAVQVRLLSMFSTRGGGHEYDCCGRDDRSMLLNYKHYFITILNVLLGSVFSSGSKNEDKPDVIETIDQRLANDNRNTGLRSPGDPRRHRRQRRVMRPTDVAQSVRRLQRHCTCPNWMLFQVDREVFAPTGQKNETSAGYARCSE